MGPLRRSRKKRKPDFSENDMSANYLVDSSQQNHGLPWPLKGLDTFESFFKISRKTFNYIFELVKDELSAKSSHSFSNGKPMSLHDQVAVALRRLSSGESLASVGASFGMHNTTVSQVTWHFVESMEKSGLKHLQWPSTDEEMTRIKSKFETIQGLPNCLGAIDTTHITMCLPLNDPDNKIWLDRQKTHSMLLQVVVDPDMKIRDIVTGWPGKLSDSSVLKNSALLRLCDEGKRLNGKNCVLSEGLEIREYVVGDSGFPLLPWLLTPYRGKSLTETEVDFNRRHFATRMIASRALARLKQMWRIINGMMWMPDKHKLPRIILVCSILHNIIIDMEDNVQDEIPLCPDHDEGYRQQLCESADLTAADMRRKLSLYLSARSAS